MLNYHMKNACKTNNILLELLRTVRKLPTYCASFSDEILLMTSELLSMMLRPPSSLDVCLICVVGAEKCTKDDYEKKVIIIHLMTFYEICINIVGKETVGKFDQVYGTNMFLK